MAQNGYTPILIYGSGTATNVPLAANMTSSASGTELAINYADGKLFYKDSSGVVQVLATKGGVGSSTNTQVLYNSSNLVVGSANMTFDGSTLTTLNSAYTGTLTGGTGVVNLGSGQFYKDASGNVGIGTASPTRRLDVRNTSTDYQLHLGDSASATLGYELGRENTAGLFKFYGNQTGATGYIFSGVDGERMRIDTSGNLLVGTTAYTGIDTGSQRLTVQGIAGGNGGTLGLISDSLGRNIVLTDSGKTQVAVYSLSSTVASIGTNTSIPLVFNTVATERMRIDSSGNVGIGTSSPSTKLEVSGTQNGVLARFGSTVSARALTITQYPTPGGTAEVGYDFNAPGAGGADGFLRFSTNSTEAMRIDSAGNLLVGTTSALSGNTFKANSGAAATFSTATSTNFSLVYFNNGTYCGSITTNGSATAFNTSSDYRLKENVQPMTGALTKIALLKPVVYKWKINGADGEGFIAHELAEIFPDAVAGEKDAIDEDGNIKPQGIDTSFLVATLTKAIQEQQALITNLTTRLTALENK